MALAREHNNNTPEAKMQPAGGREAFVSLKVDTRDMNETVSPLMSPDAAALPADVATWGHERWATTPVQGRLR